MYLYMEIESNRRETYMCKINHRSRRILCYSISNYSNFICIVTPRFN